jgi:hypothetical protein
VPDAARQREEVAIAGRVAKERARVRVPLRAYEERAGVRASDGELDRDPQSRFVPVEKREKAQRRDDAGIDFSSTYWVMAPPSPSIRSTRRALDPDLACSVERERPARPRLADQIV